MLRGVVLQLPRSLQVAVRLVDNIEALNTCLEDLSGLLSF